MHIQVARQAVRIAIKRLIRWGHQCEVRDGRISCELLLVTDYVHLKANVSFGGCGGDGIRGATQEERATFDESSVQFRFVFQKENKNLYTKKHLPVTIESQGLTSAAQRSTSPFVT